MTPGTFNELGPLGTFGRSLNDCTRPALGNIQHCFFFITVVGFRFKYIFFFSHMHLLT